MSEPAKKKAKGSSGDAIVAHADMSDANFPRDAEGRSYHVGTRRGEIANRILIVGSASRAKRIASHLDGNHGNNDNTTATDSSSSSSVFVRASDRGFCVRTGKFQGVPVTVMSIGMGVPMCDFAVREARDAVDGGMAIVRMGTCGAVRKDTKVGSVIVASKGSVMIRRDPDMFFDDDGNKSEKKKSHYQVSRAVAADQGMSKEIVASLKEGLAPLKREVIEGMNATACSFYSSQGRIDPNFKDHNEGIINDLCENHPEIESLEMESFHLLDLARTSTAKKGPIKAAAVAVALAQRHSNEFLDNASLYEIEKVGGEAILKALIKVEVENPFKDDDPACVWNN